MSIPVTVTPVTPADVTFSAAGSTAWAAGMVGTAAVPDNELPAAKISMAATNKIIGSIAATGAAVEIDCTAAGRALVDDADTAAQRTTLGVTATGADTTYAFRANNLSDLGSALTACQNLAAVRVIAKSGTPVSCGADTTEDTLATISVPAGAMGANGALRIYTAWSYTGSGNTKTFKVHFGTGGTTADPAFLSRSTSTIANVAYADVRLIMNLNSASSQGSSASSGDASPSPMSGTFVGGSQNTALGTTILITGQKATSGETLTLLWYIVELLSNGS